MATVILDDATIVQDDRVYRSLFLTGSIVLGYDYLLTLGPEVTYIWAQGIKRSTGWFLFVRYFTLLSNMATFALVFGDLEHPLCNQLNEAHGILIVIQELVVGYTLALRVLAMYSFDKRVLVTLVATAVGVLAVAAWCLVPHGPAPIFKTNIPGCQIITSGNVVVRLAAAWEAELGADILLLGFTLYHGYTRSRSEIFRYGTLWRVLVRDGAMYFGIICLANIANILIYRFGDPITSSSLSSFTVSISVAMICRLMLNLHKAGRTDTETHQTPLETLRFAGRSAVQEESVA
ncbi:hypothetical protein C8R44DRAFT_791623 [Mycena epipterygia]|nr:hypothetical protein C8R44DRAFT_791623 [Mycena epipterygia]